MPKYTCKKDCVEKKCNQYKQQRATHGRYVGQYKKREPGYWSKASKEVLHYAFDVAQLPTEFLIKLVEAGVKARFTSVLTGIKDSFN